MELRSRQENGRTSLALEGEVNIYAAAELKTRLVEALEYTPEIEIDLSAVSELDSAGLQVLLLAKRHAQETNKKLSLVGHSHPVMELIELYNLATAFGDPLVIRASDQIHSTAGAFS